MGLPTTELQRRLADRLARVLSYPETGSADAARAAAAELERGWAELAEALERLARWLDEAPAEAEERYTSLFDLRPQSSLELGLHLCGQSPQRRALLAGLSEEMQARGVDRGKELPDHLPNLIRLLGRLEQADDQHALVDSLMLPALERLNRALTDDDPWQALLFALPQLLRAPSPLLASPTAFAAAATTQQPLEISPC